MDDSNKFETVPVSIDNIQEVSSVEELKQQQNSLSEDKKLSTFKYKILESYLDYRSTHSIKDFEDAMFSKIKQLLPKAIFIYLPFFAFFMWLFHSKKKWYYYDHGIFTLYYFSFILIMSICFMILSKIDMLLHSSFVTSILTFIELLITVFIFYDCSS